MKQRIISIIVQNPEYKFACSRISKRSELTDDLYQELIIAIMELDEALLIRLYESEENSSSLSKYIIGMICRLWYSPRSPLNIKYKERLDVVCNGTANKIASQKAKEWIHGASQDKDHLFADVFSQLADGDNYNEQIDIAANSVTQLLQSMQNDRGDYFNTKVFELYMNNGQSARKVAALTGIPRSTIQDAVNRIKTTVREKINPNEL